MSTLAPHVVPATAPRTIVADPDETPDSSGVEPGGILVWTNRSQTYPTFEIVFEGPDSPASPGDILIGTGSVVVHVTKAGVFNYKILHIQRSGETMESTNRSVHSCIGC
ncbi:MAG TPA: hypothetical protein VFE27_24960 [Acidobacteriaceae bacterium]|jgi:hypothetical protein|nr:hypothetical protein [Acidobacteriaceae bacterium]